LSGERWVRDRVLIQHQAKARAVGARIGMGTVQRSRIVDNAHEIEPVRDFGRPCCSTGLDKLAADRFRNAAPAASGRC